MIAVLERGCSVKVKADIVRFIEGAGFRAQVSEAEGENFIGVENEYPVAGEGQIVDSPVLLIGIVDESVLDHRGAGLSG